MFEIGEFALVILLDRLRYEGHHLRDVLFYEWWLLFAICSLHAAFLQFPALNQSAQFVDILVKSTLDLIIRSGSDHLLCCFRKRVFH